MRLTPAPRDLAALLHPWYCVTHLATQVGAKFLSWVRRFAPFVAPNIGTHVYRLIDATQIPLALDAANHFASFQACMCFL
jgi:hypothetical protein